MRLLAEAATTARGEPSWHRRERRERSRDRALLRAQAAVDRLDRHHGSKAPMVFGLNAAQHPLAYSYAEMVKGGSGKQWSKGKGKGAAWKGMGKAGGRQRTWWG